MGTVNKTSQLTSKVPVFFWVIQLLFIETNTDYKRKPKINQHRETSLLQQPKYKTKASQNKCKTKRTNNCFNN